MNHKKLEFCNICVLICIHVSFQNFNKYCWIIDCKFDIIKDTGTSIYSLLPHIHLKFIHFSSQQENLSSSYLLLSACKPSTRISVRWFLAFGRRPCLRSCLRSEIIRTISLLSNKNDIIQIRGLYLLQTGAVPDQVSWLHGNFFCARIGLHSEKPSCLSWILIDSEIDGKLEILDG